MSYIFKDKPAHPSRFRRGPFSSVTIFSVAMAMVFALSSTSFANTGLTASSLWNAMLGYSADKTKSAPTSEFTSTIIGFEGFTAGTVHNQGGWSSLGAAGLGSFLYDHHIVNNVGAPASFGAQSLRISNAVASGAFGDQTFSVSLPNEAGETSSLNGGLSGGVRQRKFVAEWSVVSADPLNFQSGLNMSVSPDRGDGSRMGYIQFVDTASGIDVNFADFQSNTNTFVITTIATGLARNVPITVRLEMEFLDGAGNDVVRAYINGVLEHVGTSWEDYYRSGTEQPVGPPRTVDSLVFLTRGTSVPANLGKGFLIDGITLGSSTPSASVSNPFDNAGWFFFNEGANGTGSYASGPATPPLGFGSANLNVDANGRHNIATFGYAGTRLDQLTHLSYSTHQVSGNPAAAISLQFGMDYNLNDADTSFQGRLVYEPYVNGTVQQNTWQTWNALNGRFWATRAPFNATCPQANPCTLQQVLTAWPNAGIHADNSVNFFGLFILRAGGPTDFPFDGYVDNVTVGVGANSTTWNFEPINTVVVDDDGQASATDCDAATPASSTVAAGVAAANPGDTVRICPGTYPNAGTINLNKAGLTIQGAGPAKPVLQIAQAAGSLFFVTADGVTLDNLEIQKTDLAGEHNLVRVQANDFTAQNNLIYGPDPGMTWNAAGIVSRAFVVSANNNITIQNNVIHHLRQPAYISGNPSIGGTISGNNVSGTKGWVIEGGDYTFTANTWGEPQNQDCDIALLASVNPADYTPLLALSNANDNAFICAQWGGGENGRATAYVDDNASPGGNGSDNANYQSINTAVAGTLAGGTVQVAAGGYNEDVAVAKSVTINGAGVASTTVTGPIGGGTSTFQIAANNVTIRNFKITRAGNNLADWNNPGLNTAGIAIQGAFTGATVNNNLITGMRTAVDVNNSSGHTFRNNVITDNRTGFIFRNQTDNMTVVENEITNNWTVGVLFLDASSGTNSPVQTALNSNFSNNSISGNWYGQIVDRQTGGSLPAPGDNLKNFGGNWLGTTNPVISTANSAEPGYSAQIPVAFGGTAVPPGGQPDIAGTASGNVDFSPFLDSGLDTNVETTLGRGTYGFQGSLAALGVSAASPQANGSSSNIQEGIDQVNAGGTLNILNGTYTGDVNVNKVLTLKGTPTIVGTLTTSVAGAHISPGFSPGIISSGSLTLTSGSFVDIELNGTTPGTGHDQLNVTGSVDLGGATLNVTTGFVPTAGNTFRIVNNDGVDPVAGIFHDLPEGTVFFVGPHSFSITYQGGTGNDVVLTSVSLCSAVSIPSGVTTPTGVPVTVPVNVDDTTGKGLLSFDFTLNYNPAVINSPSVSLTALTSGRSLTANTSTPGVIIVSVFGALPLSGGGSLVDITFNAVGGIGTSSGLNFASFAFNEGTPCLSTSNGSVNIISGEISGSVSYAHTPFAPVPGTVLNGTGSVNVSDTTDLTGAYALNGFGAGAYTVTPSKSGDIGVAITSNDSARIAQHVAAILPMNATQIIVADVSGNGTVTSFDAALIARYVVALPGFGNTGNWTFSPTSRPYASVSSNVAGENYTAYLMGDVTGNWVTGITSFAPVLEPLRDEDRIRVAIPKVSGRNGTVMTIPVVTGDLTNRGIVSYQFDVVFNPDAVDGDSVAADISETMSGGRILTFNRVSKDTLRVAVYGALPLEGKGPLVNLKMRASGEGRSGLEIRNFMFNEDLRIASTENGELRVAADDGDSGSLTGTILNSSGNVIAGANVTLTSRDGAVFRVRSDQNGVFRFDGLAGRKSYTITVVSKGFVFRPQTVETADGAMNVNIIAEP